MLINVERLKVVASYLEEARGISEKTWMKLDKKQKNSHIMKYPDSFYNPCCEQKIRMRFEKADVATLKAAQEIAESFKRAIKEILDREGNVNLSYYKDRLKQIDNIVEKFKKEADKCKEKSQSKDEDKDEDKKDISYLKDNKEKVIKKLEDFKVRPMYDDGKSNRKLNKWNNLSGESKYKWMLDNPEHRITKEFISDL